MTGAHGNGDRLTGDRCLRLRREKPVSRVSLPDGTPGWLVTRHSAVREVLSDSGAFSRAAAFEADGPRLGVLQIPPESMFLMDPPEHTRLRRILSPAFTARSVERLRGPIEALVDELIAAMREQGPPADFVADFALPLPIMVISELLGVPLADRHDVRRWSETMATVEGRPIEETRQAYADMHEYLRRLVDAKRGAPRADLIGDLIAAQEDEDRLTEGELIDFAMTVLIAGHETTANQLANILIVLLRDPARPELLRRRPELIPAAVEELLRYIRLLDQDALLVRRATRDVELSGVRIRAGDLVIPDISSANRDERAFPHSARLDLTRDRAPHLAFGHGAHYCLGAHLARLELQTALAGLLARLPALRLAVREADIPWRHGTAITGPRTLPITWTPEPEGEAPAAADAHPRPSPR
ncbi:cytochrome P450 [Bailinhaonella thermotolerans]|uniref:Cytochrome P450 n=1 Tax=Bailinhaonella thermotolerans TaxID=1070861 RepID=A0A3A4AXT2_9ACTN|nr:cytochrome P450 [Bailinhaonella thermotolerans]RJL35482.1 cytochrome P450 [Bailinhaonella thermotolerans]